MTNTNNTVFKNGSKLQKVQLAMLADDVQTKLTGYDSQLAQSSSDISTLKGQITGAVSGSPMPVTLASQMTDHTRNYVYLGSESGYSSGNIYYWNGSAFTDSGKQYQSTGIADQTVSISKTTFATIGKNLFNKNAVTDGILSISNGTISANASYKVSDYIPIKSGVTYFVNSCRNYVIFNTNKIFASGTDNSSNGSATFTAAQDGFLRISVYINNLNTCQIEVGSTSTSYEPFKVTINGLYVPGSAVASVDGNIINDNTVAASKTNFIAPSKNLFNKSKSTSGYRLVVDGTIVADSNYKYSDYIPIKANTNYSLSKCRNYVYYDTNKTYISGTDNATSAAVVINKPNDGYIRFSYAPIDESTIQFELGTAPTSYADYGLTMSDLNLTDTQKNSILAGSSTKDLTLIKTGEIFQLTSSFDGTQNITLTMNRSGSLNGSFSFTKTVIGSVQIHDTSDDITPIRTFTTVGGNHGYPTVIRVTMANHGKTTSDLGSKWTDGITTYTLLDIIGNDLILGCPYTVTNGVVSSSYIAPVANLTHVSGATNTGNIDVTTLVASPSLYPSINNKSVKFFLDGIEITADGTYYGTELQVRESYNIMDYKAIIDYAQANIGVSYKNDNVAGVIKMSINYTFIKGCKCLMSHSIKALSKVTLAACGFLQSVALLAPGYTLKRYVPNIVSKSGYDFQNIVDMTSYNSDLLYYVADLTKPSIAPNRHVDWLYNGSAKTYGFTMGYIIDKTNSKSSDVLSQIGTNYILDLRSTKKFYPVAINGITLNAGDYKTILGYRNYIAPSDPTVTNVNVVKDKKDTYVYIDYHQNVNGGNVKLNDYIGKTVIVIDSQNFTLLNDVVDTEGVTFNITNNYGYAILKVS